MEDEQTKQLEETAEEETVHLRPKVTGEGSSVRAIIIGVLIVALVLILGALYIWGSTLTRTDITPPPAPPNNEPETPRADADVQILETVSSSDELSAIEADLDSTDLDQLDAELDSIESELY